MVPASIAAVTGGLPHSSLYALGICIPSFTCGLVYVVEHRAMQCACYSVQDDNSASIFRVTVFY